VRNVEGGTERVWETRGTSALKRCRRVVDSDGDVAMGDGTPGKELAAGRLQAVVARETLKGSEAHERMNPRRKSWGTTVVEDRAGEVGNGDVTAGSGNPTCLVHHRSQDSKRS